MQFVLVRSKKFEILVGSTEKHLLKFLLSDNFKEQLTITTSEWALISIADGAFIIQIVMLIIMNFA